MLISGRAVCSAVGVILLLWSYYQLFAVDLERTYIDKQITAVTAKGYVSGKAVGIKNDSIVIASNGAISEIPKQNVFKIDNFSVDEYETRRVLWTIAVAMSGGVLIWIALFF